MTGCGGFPRSPSHTCARDSWNTLHSPTFPVTLRLRDGHDTALTVCEGCGVELVPVYAGEQERPAWWEMPDRQRLSVEHTAARCRRS